MASRTLTCFRFVPKTSRFKYQFLTFSKNDCTFNNFTRQYRSVFINNAITKPYLMTTWSNVRGQFYSQTVNDVDVTYEDLEALLRSKDIQLIDVREPNELVEHGKIPGSVNIPLSRMREFLLMSDEAFAEHFKHDKPQLYDRNIVFYGLGPIKSKAALEIARKMGFVKARHYRGGWEEYAKKTGQVKK